MFKYDDWVIVVSTGELGVVVDAMIVDGMILVDVDDSIRGRSIPVSDLRPCSDADLRARLTDADGPV